MNVNSSGNNLDTRFEQFFQEIKHTPGQKPGGCAFIFCPTCCYSKPLKRAGRRLIREFPEVHFFFINA